MMAGAPFQLAAVGFALRKGSNPTKRLDKFSIVAASLLVASFNTKAPRGAPLLCTT